MKKKFKINLEIVKEITKSTPKEKELKPEGDGVLKRLGTSILSGACSGLGHSLVTGTGIPWEYLMHLYNFFF